MERGTVPAAARRALRYYGQEDASAWYPAVYIRVQAVCQSVCVRYIEKRREHRYK